MVDVNIKTPKLAGSDIAQTELRPLGQFFVVLLRLVGQFERANFLCSRGQKESMELSESSR